MRTLTMILLGALLGLAYSITIYTPDTWSLNHVMVTPNSVLQVINK